MNRLTYATTNLDKFTKAAVNLKQFDIELEQVPLELDEPQSFDGEKIVLHKAKQAHDILQQPVLVGDDSWSIPALKGFPATNMKQCNHFLTSEDWLRLMSGIADRRIFLIAYVAFANGSQPRVISYSQEAYFLNQIQGVHDKAPHLTVIAWQGQTKSVAEVISEGIKPREDLKEIWTTVASWVK